MLRADESSNSSTDKTRKITNVLLVYTHLRTGGIETLIVRMANWLSRHGLNVTLFLLEPGELLELLDKDIRVIVCPVGNRFFAPHIGRKHVHELDTDFDLIYSYGPEGCYIASFIYKYNCSARPPVFLNGVYHPYEFALDGGVSVSDRIRINFYNDYLSDSAKLFMSEPVRSGNELIIGRELPDSKIWPLPVETRPYDRNRKPLKNKIVSVGRFERFKTYNLHMIDVMEELLNTGYDVHWDVYGYGTLETEMKNKIKEKNLCDRISLKGVLPYDELTKTLSTAQVFVGVGTALIEAGFCGVPCVVGIDNDEGALSYGGLYELPYFACGERLSANAKTTSIVNAIRRILEMDASRYEAECYKTYQYVQAYSMNSLMKEFLDYAENLPTEQVVGSYPAWRYYTYILANWYQLLKKRIAIRSRLKLA